ASRPLHWQHGGPRGLPIPPSSHRPTVFRLAARQACSRVSGGVARNESSAAGAGGCAGTKEYPATEPLLSPSPFPDTRTCGGNQGWPGLESSEAPEAHYFWHNRLRVEGR